MLEFKDIMYLTGDIFEWLFRYLEMLGNFPNYLYGVLMFMGLLYWLNWQRKMNIEARKNGTIE